MHALAGETAKFGDITVSIGFDGREVEGQTWDQIVADMNWEMAATIASTVMKVCWPNLPATQRS